MANYSTTLPSRPKTDLSALGDQCDPVRSSHGLPMANVAERLSQLEYGLRHLWAMAKQGNLAKDPRCLAGKGTPDHEIQMLSCKCILESCVFYSIYCGITPTFAASSYYRDYGILDVLAEYC